MSLTLGEKLRQAREERGFTLSEVADQTRISGLYLESIENDEYRTLPGGIFNKGFVKSYAKFVGINEQEALTDYSALISKTDIIENPELKLYRPEVLTDGPSGISNAPTIILAVVILSLMSVGVWFLVNYLRPPEGPVAANTQTKANANINATTPSDGSTELPSNLPEMATVKIEFKAVGQPVRLIATNDGEKSDNVVAAGSSANFEPKESLILNYNRWNATSAQLTINGKPITLPSEPLKNATDKARIEFTISKENLDQIWMDGAISKEVPAAVVPDSNTVATTTNTAAPAGTPPPRTTPVTPPANKPPTNTNTAPKPAPTKAPSTPAPATPAPKPPSNTEF